MNTVQFSYLLSIWSLICWSNFGYALWMEFIVYTKTYTSNKSAC